MKPVFLTLEDGAVFAGRSVGDVGECAGLLSFFTGVVGYQEVITYPANAGKIVMFTYPLIGNAGVNSADAQSDGPKVNGIVTVEYPPYYSNFRAEGSLGDYLEDAGVFFGTAFDTRAVMLHIREHGEMLAAVSEKQLDPAQVRTLAAASKRPAISVNSPVAAEQPKYKAAVIDLGASKTFYKKLASLGVSVSADKVIRPGDNSLIDDVDFVVVTQAPYYSVEDEATIEWVRKVSGNLPLIGFGHGAAIAARARGGEVERLPFGDHGVNVPVKSAAGGRNEITVQNHNYAAKPGGETQCLFTNLHDGACEGFCIKSAKAAGTNFLPGPEWFELLLSSVRVN